MGSIFRPTPTPAPAPKPQPRPKPKPVIQDIDPSDPAYSQTKRRGRKSSAKCGGVRNGLS